MKNKLKYYLSSFYIFLSMLVSTCLLVLNLSVFSYNYLSNIFDSNNYYEGVYGHIKDNMKDSIMSSGITDDDIDLFLTKDMVKSDIKKVFKDLYSGIEINLDTTSLKTNIHTTILNIAEKNKLAITKEMSKDIEKLENRLVSIYKENIVYNENALNSLSKAFRLARILSIVVIIILLLSSILIIKLNKEVIDSRFFEQSLLSTGLFLVILKMLVGNSFNSILIFNQTFSINIIDFISGMLSRLFVIGFVYILITFVLILRDFFSK